MGRLDGKVAIVTGAARGQGAAIARRFVEEGARVLLTDVLSEEGELTAKSLGEAARFVGHDVTNASEWGQAVTAAGELGPLSVLVNNAGIFAFTPLASVTTAEYLRIVQVNQLGVFLGMQAVAPAMTAGGGGSIINTSSTAGLKGTAGTIAYSASKWAVRGMTKVAALELAPHGIRVNSVHPGVVDTPMLPAGSAERANAAIPLGRARTTGRHRAAGAVPRIRRELALHRRGVRDRRR